MKVMRSFKLKLAHTIILSVFAKESEDSIKLAEKLVELISLDLDEEKISLNKGLATGFNNKQIRIFEIILTKQRHINKFLNFFNNNLSQEQKQLLIEQQESRLDSDLTFFIRLDKDKLVNENKYQLTDSGNCFHIKIVLAAYPKKREKGIVIINLLFNPKS